MFRDEARKDPSFAAYAGLEHAKTVDVTTDYDVFGDGSVTILQTPGHTPGHMSLLVRLKKAGPVLLSETSITRSKRASAVSCRHSTPAGPRR